MSTPSHTFNRLTSLRIAVGVSFLALLTACDEQGNFNIGLGSDGSSESTPQTTVVDGDQEFIEKDVESPDVFYAKEKGLWDGRPSLGGVWVAHPDVGQPERVIIRNKSNGRFVIGALFRRERENPGPRLQLSSDAAQAIEVLAGAPVDLEVVALRKQKTPVAPPPQTGETPEVAENEPSAAVNAQSSTPAPEPATPSESEAIEQTTLDPIAAAEAAIESAPPTNVETSTIATAATAGSAAAASGTATTVTSTLPVSTLDRPFVQAGTFGVEANATTAADQLRSAGLTPDIKQQTSDGKTAWRVIVGPAGSADERAELLTRVKNAGYSDAYVVAR